ncbi:hypothetical protein D3C84_785850 [compost metagenome]
MQRGVQGVAHELRSGRVNVHALQCHVITHAFLLQGHEAFDDGRAGPHFAHRIEVQLEMAVMAVGRTISLIRRAACGSLGGSQGN